MNSECLSVTDAEICSGIRKYFEGEGIKKVEIHSIGLILTNKCNAKCDMCVFECSPSNNDKMDIDDARRYVNEAKNIPSIKNVYISGGEPFLFYNDLLVVLDTVKNNGLLSTVNTNGFWATDIENTKIIMLELKMRNCTRLEIGVDEFHLKYIPIQNIKHILEVGRKLNFHIEMYSVVTKSSMPIVDLEKQIENRLYGYEINKLYCVPVGRAKTNIKKDEFIFSTEIPKSRCNRQHIVCIFPDGSCYPCCSHNNFAEILYLGSIKELGLEKVLENANNNIMGNIISYIGTGWLIDMVQNNNLPINLEKQYVTICGLCQDLLLKNEYLKYYMPYINRIYKIISNNIMELEGISALEKN